MQEPIKKNLRFLYDIMTAMPGVWGDTEAVKTLENNIIGPFAPLPIPPQVLDETKMIPNY